MEEPHDPRYVTGGTTDGEFVATDVEINVRELFFDVPQRLVMAAERLDHLIGVVEKDYLGPDAGEGMGELPGRALSGGEPALSVS
jgi:hypothetical protein